MNGTLPWPERTQHLEYVDREGRVRDLYDINDYLDHPPRYFTNTGVQTDLIADITQHVLDNSDVFNEFWAPDSKGAQTHSLTESLRNQLGVAHLTSEEDLTHLPTTTSSPVPSPPGSVTDSESEGSGRSRATSQTGSYRTARSRNSSSDSGRSTSGLDRTEISSTGSAESSDSDYPVLGSF